MTVELAEKKAAEGISPLGYLVDLGLDNYKWGKDLVVENKTLGPRVGPIVSYGEEKFVSVLKRSPIQVEDVVTAVDSRVEKVVTYSAEKIQTVRETPGKLKNATLTFAHEKLQSLKVDTTPEDDEETKEGEDLSVGTVVVDARVVTAERLNMFLDASEGYLQQYLPPSELAEGENVEEEPLGIEGKKTEIRPVANRALRLSKVAAKRVQERALSRVGQLKRRTTDVVHVDLVKYSEWLDKQKNGVKDTIYISLEKVDNKLVKPAKETIGQRVEQVQVYAGKTQDAIKTRVITPAKERIVAIRLPFHDRIINVWTTVGNQYNEKVIKPRDQIIQMFREELALQQELAKRDNGEDMTIGDGLAAVIAAARARLSKEYEVRISPVLSKFMGKNTDFEEDEEKSSVGDEDEVESE